MLTDPVGDMLTRIRNGHRARHPRVSCPSSKLKVSIARLLKEEGFLAQSGVDPGDGKPILWMDLRYREDGRPIIDGMRRVSKPGRRVYVGVAEIPKVRNGLGVAVLSTPKGVLTDRAAREATVGGEVLFEVW